MFMILIEPATDPMLTLSATDPTSSTGQSRGSQVAHSVVLGTFNIADQGDGVLPDLNRVSLLVEMVLNKFLFY